MTRDEVELSQPHQWQPIATAPKNTMVLVGWVEYQYPALAVFTGNQWVSDEIDVVFTDPPTHWMPLPSPPAETK